MVSAKQVGRWRPACRQQIRWNRGVLSLQMGENFLNNNSVFDAGDHFGRTAAGTACLNVVMNTRASATSSGSSQPSRSMAVLGSSVEWTLRGMTVFAGIVAVQDF